MDSKYFIAFDLGATSGRTILGTLTGDKLTLEEVTRFPNQMLQLNGHFYWNIFSLYENLKKGLAAVAQKKVSVTSIGIDTWGVDFAFVNEEGALIGLPYAYRDPQTIGKKEEFFEKVLVSALPKNITMQKTIADAMEYSLMAGGKRLRPMLMLEAYRLFGGSDEAEIEPFMAAIEMIHTYSLVHDDLPAMDNDEYRRGRKTTHIVYGEDMGILAGDALLNYAYETAVEGALKLKDPANGLKALQILSRKAGVYHPGSEKLTRLICRHTLSVQSLLQRRRLKQPLPSKKPLTVHSSYNDI